MGSVRPIPLGTDSEHRPLTELKAYKATSVQRLPNRQGAPSLAVRVTFTCEALPCRVKVGLQVFEVTPYAARVWRCIRCQKNLIIQQNFASKPYRSVHGAGGGVTEERGVVPLPLAKTARAHITLPGWGAPSIALDFSQTK